MEENYNGEKMLQGRNMKERPGKQEGKSRKEKENREEVHMKSENQSGWERLCCFNNGIET